MPSTSQELRRGDKVGGPTDESRRAEAQRHLDGRQQRLEAYAASLEDALAAHPSVERSVELEEKLAQVRRDIRAASRPRVPRARTPDVDGDSATTSHGT